MIAITITQVVKDLNPSLFKNYEVGSIRQLSSIPKSFYSPTYFVGQRTDGYQTLIDIHEADGFFSIVKPTYDTAIEKLGDLFFDVTTQKFTHPVIAFTQFELDANLETNEDSEARTKIDAHTEKGANLYGRCERKIWRRRFKDSDANNKLTNGDARSLKKWFAPVYQWLILGNFQQAKQEIAKVITNNQTELDLVQGMIGTATWFQTEILDYFDNKYDL